MIPVPGRYTSHYEGTSQRAPTGGSRLIVHLGSVPVYGSNVKSLNALAAKGLVRFEWEGPRRVAKHIAAR